MLYSNINNHYLNSNKNVTSLPTMFTATTPSLFSIADQHDDNNNYESKLKEMEDYYVKNLLNDTDDIEPDTRSKQLRTNNNVMNNTIATSASLIASQRQPISTHPYYSQMNHFQEMTLPGNEQRQIRTTRNNIVGGPLQQYLSNNNNYSNLMNENDLLSFPVMAPPNDNSIVSAHKSHKNSLEVEINSNFIPSSNVLPLTTENLEKLSLSEVPPAVINQPTLPIQKTTPKSPIHYTQSHSHPQNIQQQHHHHHHHQQQQQHQQQNVNKQLYKTELCESFTTKGHCKYGNKCQFAHGLHLSLIHI